MAIEYPDKFDKARPAGFDGIFNWDFLLPIFEETNIRPMDFDAVIERRGKILIIETKSPNKDIPLGQEITLKSILKIGKGRIFVFVFYGKDESTISKMEEWRYSRGRIQKDIFECDSTRCYARVNDWFKWANKIEGGPPC